AAAQAIGVARVAAAVSAVAVDAAGASRIGSAVVGGVPAGTVGGTGPIASTPNLLSWLLSRGPLLGRAVSCSGLRGQELLTLAVKSYHQIFERPVVVGDLGTC